MKINLDSPVIVFLTTVADFMILNILFILCCAPVITIGPAVSALYTITMREARHEGGYIFKPFFKAFKNNFKQAFLLSILYLIIGASFVFGVKFWIEKPEFSTVNQVILVITGVFAVIFIFSLLLQSLPMPCTVYPRFLFYSFFLPVFQHLLSFYLKNLNKLGLILL